MIDQSRKFGPQRVRFEDFEADLRTEELTKQGIKLRLPHQSFCVLAMLVERAGELVTREELRARLWPASTLIEYDPRLNAAVNRLREVLVDSAEEPRFIETLPKRGYRFIARIERSHLAFTAVSPGPSGEANEDLALSAETKNVAAPEPAANAVPQAVGGKPPFTSRMAAHRRFWFPAVAGLAAVVLLAVSINWMAGRSRTHFPFGRQVVPFASLPGKEISPSFSPDGSQVVFAWDQAADVIPQFDLYVKSLGSERLLRLTHHPSRWISSAWSPDGSTIAFIRQSEEGVGIFVIPALGGSERSILTKGIAGGYTQVSWSPDGHALAYSAYAPTGAPQVNIVSLDTANSRQLSPAPECSSATQPAFSPDGGQLALICASSAEIYKVYVVGLPDGPLTMLASMSGEPQGLAWSADGSRLILSNDSGDGGELWQLTLSGERQQLPFGEDGTAPTVATRGGRMAYVRTRKNVDIWRADLGAPQPEQSATKLIHSTRTQVLPRYSPDGTRIVFLSNRSGSAEIWMSDSQGADPDRLTSFNGAPTGAASWCSDGRRIAFDSRLGSIAFIYIEDINERVPRKLATSRENLSSPVWSEDCHWLFAIDAKNMLYRIPSSGGPAERFTDHPSSYFIVSADRLIFNFPEPNGVVLWSKPVGGGPQVPIEGMPRVSYADSWAPTAAGIYYTDSSSKPVTLNFYDFASRSTRTLMRLKQSPIPGNGPGFSVSSDGRWLLYGQSGDESSEIMLAPDR